MKKFMALCLAMLMALSMVSFSVMAEGGVDFAEIANGQPVNFVTADLDLGGYEITSSNEDVIALNGTVTRPLFEDKTVQITIDGGEAIDVTVKAKSVEALYAEDFSIDNEAVLEGEYYRFADYSEWYLGKSNGAVSIADGKLTANHNDSARVWMYHKAAAPVTEEPVTIQFDVTDIADVAVGIDIRFSGNFYDADGNVIGSLNSGTTITRLSANGFGANWMGAYKKAGVTMKYNPVTGEFWGNGVLSAKNLFTDNATMKEGYTSEDIAKVVVSNLCFVDASDAATGTYSIDNFVVYQDVPEEDVLANATAAEKAAYYASFLDAEYVANGGDFAALTTNLNFAAEEELPAGVEILWESDDADVIAADGTVTRPFFEAKEVTIDGALVIDGEEFKTVTYTVTVLPLSVGSATEILDAENYDLGSFVGATGWTAEIKDWEVMEVKADADGSKYFTMSASSYQPNGTAPKYTFATNPTVGAGETLVVDARVRIPEKGGAANWYLTLNGKEIAEFIYFSGNLYDNDYDVDANANTEGHQFDDYYGPSAARNDKPVTAGTWYDIRFEITEDAAATKGWTVNCFIDGAIVGTHSTANAVPAEITSAAFVFKGRGNADSATAPTAPKYFFDVDDVQVYTSRDVDSVLGSLDDAGKVNFFKELAATTVIRDVTTGQTLQLDANYADYDLDALGVSIDWASGDDDYISNDGKVLKLAPVGEEVVVDMTATVTAGAEVATATIEVTLTDGTVLIKEVNFDDLEGALGSAEVIADGTGKALHLKHEGTGHKASGTITNVTGGGRGDRVVFEADLKYIHSDVQNSYGGFSVKTYAGQNGIQLGLNYKAGTVSLITTMPVAKSAADGLDVNKYKTVSYPMPASVLAKGEGEWVKLAVDHNVLSQTYSVYLDGELVNPIPVLQANMDIGSNGGSAIRGYSIELSLAGEMWVDNVSLKKYANTDAVEVNAALNAALIQFASPVYRTVLTNCELPAMTIGKSWIKGTSYDRDLHEEVTDNGDGTTKSTFSIKPENASTYKYVTDGPTLTYEVNGEAVDAINVDKAGVVELTITAEANGISESLTVERQVAPVAIRGLAQGTASCLNGVWLDGAKGDEKVVIVTYLENNKADWVQVFDLAELADKELTDTNHKTYDTATGILRGTGVAHPGTSDVIEEVKIFVIGNGITPVSFRSGMLDW